MASLAVDWGRVGRVVLGQLAALLGATLVVGVLEDLIGLHPASSVYLLAVAAVAIVSGSVAAAGSAIGAFFLYNFLFVTPRYTFTVGEPNGLLNLILLLVVGVLIGRLTGLQRDRAREATRREREARAVFAVTRSLASTRRVREALPGIVERLRAETRMSRVWIGLGETTLREQIQADTGRGAPPEPGPQLVLRRTPDERRPEWVRISQPARRSVTKVAEQLYRVAISDGTDEIGSLWALRPTALAQPTPEESRLLATTADSIGQSVLRDRLATQATEREIAQRSDELKSALLDTVSHDLRTPLATIRAAAGSLADPEIAWREDDRVTTAQQIDAEADRLNRIVGNLLDMSRIQAGALRPEIEVLPVEETLRAALQRSSATLAGHAVELAVSDGLPPVLADPAMLEEALVNLFENIGRHTPPGAPVLVAADPGEGRIVVRVEDGGPGLPVELLRRIFEKFFRHPSPTVRSGRGTGLGLSVVRGMVEVMGGEVSAAPSPLGGLAVRLELPAARPASQEADLAEPVGAEPDAGSASRSMTA